MKISTRGRYALRVMLELANRSKGEYVAVKELSERQGLSLKYLESIISPLANGGFVDSRRGKSGGYALTRTPKDYTVGSILKLVEGSLRPVACLDAGENTCPRKDACMTLPFWQGLSDAVDRYVESVTLQDLIDRRLGESFQI